ncbi:MAG: sigma-70 family RNA polymerase sigma factor [Pseudomonadota bacterium]
MALEVVKLATMSPDTPLLERVACGDRTAVSACIDRYSGLVWSLARRFVANEADAEEVVQEIFIELWSTAARFDATRASEATYVSMIARRRLIDHVRRVARAPAREMLTDVEHLLARDGEPHLEATSETGRVLQAMTSMSCEQKQVVHMSTWLGMSHAAIAERTGQPLGTVKSHLRRGLIAIREQLGLDATGGSNEYR